MWLYFLLFAVLILIVLWSLQIIFLRSFYQSMKTHEIINTANKLENEYGSDDFGNIVSGYTFRNNMSVYITDMEGNMLFSSGVLRGVPGRVSDNVLDRVSDNVPGRTISESLNDNVLDNVPENKSGVMPGNAYGDIPVSIPGEGKWYSAGDFGGLSANDYTGIYQKLKQSGSDSIHYIISSPAGKMQMLVYIAIIKSGSIDKAILYIASPVDPIDSTTAILKNQLLIVTIILLVLAFIISFFISRRLSRPVENLTVSARLLAGGDYNVIFENGNYSELTELSKTLNYATMELSKTDGLRKELVANISHDLRTPLTMIKMYAEMIRDLSGENPKKRSEHVNVITEEVDRLSNLVDDILALSKIESGTSEMNCHRLDLSQMVRIIAKRFNVHTERDGYFFSINCDDGIYIDADEKRIEQVIYNLISNAVNYTGDDKQVSISLKDSGIVARFEVADTGNGIPEEEIENIWERYYKAKETHKRAIAGTGLGLAIVRNILKAHQARFGVESTVGKGSTFWFELKKSN